MDSMMDIVSMTASGGPRMSLNLIVHKCFLTKPCDSLLCIISRAKRSSHPGNYELFAVTHTFHALVLFWPMSMTFHLLRHCSSPGPWEAFPDSRLA